MLDSGGGTQMLAGPGLASSGKTLCFQRHLWSLGPLDCHFPFLPKRDSSSTRCGSEVRVSAGWGGGGGGAISGLIPSHVHVPELQV